MGEMIRESLRGWHHLPDLSGTLRIPIDSARRGHAHRRLLSQTPSCASCARPLRRRSCRPTHDPGALPSKSRCSFWGLFSCSWKRLLARPTGAASLSRQFLAWRPILIASFFLAPASPAAATAPFWSFYTADPLAIFFKRFALATTILVLVMAMDYAPAVRLGVSGANPQPGLGEFFALPIFTCAGLMWMASAIDFVMIFVSLELVTISFYVLVSFTRRNPGDARGRSKVSDPERAFDRILGLRHYLDFWRDRRNEPGQRSGPFSPAQDFDKIPLLFGIGAGSGRARIQDRRRPIPDLGAGCLSRRADAGNGLPFRWLEGGRISWFCCGCSHHFSMLPQVGTLARRDRCSSR